MLEEWLTPEHARERFGRLNTYDWPRSYYEFKAPEGTWKPTFGADLALLGYRLEKNDA